MRFQLFALHLKTTENLRWFSKQDDGLLTACMLKRLNGLFDFRFHCLDRCSTGPLLMGSFFHTWYAQLQSTEDGQKDPPCLCLKGSILWCYFLSSIDAIYVRRTVSVPVSSNTLLKFKTWRSKVPMWNFAKCSKSHSVRVANFVVLASLFDIRYRF